MNAWTCSKCKFRHRFSGTRCSMCSSLRVTTEQMRNFISGNKTKAKNDSGSSDGDGNGTSIGRDNNSNINGNKSANADRNSSNTTSNSSVSSGGGTNRNSRVQVGNGRNGNENKHGRNKKGGNDNSSSSSNNNRRSANGNGGETMSNKKNNAQPQPNIISLVDEDKNKSKSDNNRTGSSSASDPPSQSVNVNNTNHHHHHHHQTNRSNQNMASLTSTSSSSSSAMKRRIINPYLRNSSSNSNKSTGQKRNTGTADIQNNNSSTNFSRTLTPPQTNLQSQNPTKRSVATASTTTAAVANILFPPNKRNSFVNTTASVTAKEGIGNNRQNQNGHMQQQQRWQQEQQNMNCNPKPKPVQLQVRKVSMIQNPYLKRANKNDHQYQSNNNNNQQQQQQLPQHKQVEKSKMTSAKQDQSSTIQINTNNNSNSTPNSGASVTNRTSPRASSPNRTNNISELPLVHNQQKLIDRETNSPNYNHQRSNSSRSTNKKRTRQQTLHLSPTPNSNTMITGRSSAQRSRPNSLHNFAQEKNVPLRNYVPGPVQLETENGVHRSWVYPVSDKYSEREYQLVISRSAVLQNTLVSLPTGLGKTLIAAVVMYNFYRWFPTGKVVFLAPTRPLVTQQIEACYNIMGIPEIHTAEMSGKTKQDQRGQLWEERRLFFCTPQTFQKDIEDGRCNARNVVCVVVDEAHKATGKYAYVQVIDLIEQAGGKFRVLGLSATPGKDIKDVCEIVKALRISKIEAKLDSDADVKKYTFHKEFEYIVVEPTSEVQIVSSMLEKILDPLLEQLRNRGGLRKFRVANTSISNYNHLECFKENKDQTLYPLYVVTGELVRVRQALRESGIGVARKKLRTFMSRVATKTDKLSKMPQCTRLVQSESFRRFFAAVADTQDLGGDAPPTPVQLKTNNPKLSKLEDILIEHFERSRAVGTCSRAIVFSQLRDSVEEIVHVLKYLEPLIRPSQFVGQGSGSSGVSEGSTIKTSGKKIPGMNQKEQQKVIAKFKRDKYNVLVCTSIGEEGLDIGEVDLIVNYDCLRSSTRMTQRIGRTGRKRDGRVVCLIAKGAEERKLQQSERSTKTLYQALKPGGYSNFPFIKNLPLLPEHPILTRKDMGIEKKYQMSQIGGHDTKAISKRRSQYYAQDYQEDDTWKLSVTQDIDRCKQFGRFDGRERFTVKSSLKSWQKSINNRSKLSLGSGRLCGVLRNLEHLVLSQKLEQAQADNRKIRTTLEQENLYNSSFDPSENISAHSISDDESVQNCYFPSEEEDNVVSIQAVAGSDNGTNNQTNSGTISTNCLDAIFGKKRQWRSDNQLPDIFQAIIFDEASHTTHVDSEKSNKSFDSISLRNEEVIFSSRGSNSHNELDEEVLEVIVTSQDDDEEDIDQECLAHQNDIDQGKKLSMSESIELESEMSIHALPTEPSNNSRTYCATKEGKKDDEPGYEENTYPMIHQSDVVSRGSPKKEGIPLLGDSLSIDGDMNTDHISGRTVTINPEEDGHKKGTDLQSENTKEGSTRCIHPTVNSTLVIEDREKNINPIETSKGNKVDQKGQDIETSSQQSTEPSEELPLPSFCLDLPSQKSSTSSSEDSDSDSGDSRISFTIKVVGEEGPLNDTVTNPPPEEHLGDNALQEVNNTQASPAKTVNDKQQNKGDERNDTSSLHHQKESQESQESQDTPIKLNQRKRKNLPMIDEMQDDTSHDFTPTPIKIGHKSFAPDNLTDTPDRRIASSIHNLTSPQRSTQSNDLVDTPSSLKRRKEAKMNDLVKHKRQKMNNTHCKFLDLEAVDDDDDECVVESEGDDETRPSQDSFINDSSQLGYSQTQFFSQDEFVTSHRQIDTLNREENIFSTPVLNRRQRHHHQQTQSSLPSSEKAIGKMYFVRSLMKHAARGGDPNDVEREYNALLSKPGLSQNEESINNESVSIKLSSQSDSYIESPSQSSQNMRKATELTSEQRARSERNRQRAIMIRKARLKEQENLKKK